MTDKAWAVVALIITALVVALALSTFWAPTGICLTYETSPNDRVYVASVTLPQKTAGVRSCETGAYLELNGGHSW